MLQEVAPLMNFNGTTELLEVSYQTYLQEVTPLLLLMGMVVPRLIHRQLTFSAKV